MGKGGKSQIFSREALAIAKKLGAAIEPGAKHDKVIIRYQDRIIATYGVRRSRSVSHGYVPSQIFVSETEALRLATCTMSAAEYYEKMLEKGKIAAGS